MSRFAFAEQPPVGLVLSIAGQPFRLARFEPFERRDGSASCLAVWVAPCRQCGVPFEQTLTVLRFPELRNCELHRKQGRPA